MRKPLSDFIKIFCLAAVIGTAPALGQVEQTTRVVGTVERVDGSNLTIKAAQSEKVVSIPQDATVFAMIKANLSDIKPGAFIGVGATPRLTTASGRFASSSSRNRCAGWEKDIVRGTGPVPR